MYSLYTLARPLLFRMEPEQAHDLTLFFLKKGLAPKVAAIGDPALCVSLWGKHFSNPIGLAAGFDKNAAVIGAMFGLGFGFVEAGTVTPKPQEGNPKPRIFRDPAHEAVVNRMGFPGGGVDLFKENLQKFRENHPHPAGLIGLNIGMNKVQAEPVEDYCFLIRTLAPLADYLTVNISSPNTPGLRDLQKPENLEPFLRRLLEEKALCCKANKPPLLLKLAPDLDAVQREAIAGTVLDCGIDGLILGNTTLERPAYLPEDFAAQKGGLSGKPLKDKATGLIRDFYRLTEGRIPIIGVGGVSSGIDAYEKIKAGACLIQLYTALVFQGPDVVRRINQEILQLLKRDGHGHISEAVGTECGGAYDRCETMLEKTVSTALKK